MTGLTIWGWIDNNMHASVEFAVMIPWGTCSRERINDSEWIDSQFCRTKSFLQASWFSGLFFVQVQVVTNLDMRNLGQGLSKWNYILICLHWHEADSCYKPLSLWEGCKLDRIFISIVVKKDRTVIYNYYQIATEQHHPTSWVKRLIKSAYGDKTLNLCWISAKKKACTDFTARVWNIRWMSRLLRWRFCRRNTPIWQTFRSLDAFWFPILISHGT